MKEEEEEEEEEKKKKTTETTKKIEEYMLWIADLQASFVSQCCAIGASCSQRDTWQPSAPEKEEDQEDPLSGVLFDFPLSELLSAAMHLCWVPDTPVTAESTTNAAMLLQPASLFAAADQSADLP